MRHVRALAATLVLAAALAVSSHSPVAAEPSEAVGDTRPAAAALSAGAYTTCVVGNDGSARCWGANGVGQLGQGDTTPRGGAPDELGAALPAIDLGAGRTAQAITIGGSHACALLDDDTVKCWGFSASGQLGQGTTFSRGYEPDQLGDALPAIDLAGRAARSVVAGGNHTCALLSDGTVSCWGQGVSGQLGNGDSISEGEYAEEVNVGDADDEMGAALESVSLGAGRTATAVAAGQNHTCALLDNGTVKCWGNNMGGELGLGDTDNRGDDADEMGGALAAVNLGTGRTASAISAGANHTCAVLDNGAVKCWGDNSYGQLGLGDTDGRGDAAGEMGDALAAVSLGAGRTATAVSASDVHTCALLDNGAVKCWGDNQAGQLGHGTTDDMVGDQPGDMGANLPTVQLGAGRHAVAVTAGTDHTCVLRDDGTVTCWGAGFFGQTGRGSTADTGRSPSDMGDALQPVDLNGPAGPAAFRSTLTADKATVDVGDTITYTSTLRNVGGSDLTGITVTSTTASGCNRTLPTLPIGGTTTFTCTDVAAVGDVPTLTNSLTITTDQGVTRTTSAAVTVRRPVTRSVAVTYSGPSGRVMVGDPIEFTGTITNDGDVTLTDVVYLSTGAPYVSRSGPCSEIIPTLRVGQTVTVKCGPAYLDSTPSVVRSTLTVTATGMGLTTATASVTVEPVRVRVDGVLRWGPQFRHAVGDDVYKSTSKQTLDVKFERGRTTEFLWQVQNEGTNAQRLRLGGTRGNKGYDVDYTMNNTDVSGSVTRSRFDVLVQPGDSVEITVAVTANSKAKGRWIVRLTAKSAQRASDTVAIRGRIDKK